MKRLAPEHESLKCYFEEESGKQHPEREELILETQQESKERHDSAFEGSFRGFEEGLQLKEKAETAEKEKEEEYWV